MPEFDRTIRAGRVFCAETGLDGPGEIAIAGDRIVASGARVLGQAPETMEFPDCLLLPGLVDLHTHPAPSDWKFGIDPGLHMLPRGSTTVLSQGDAGAASWPAYRDDVMERSQTRVRLAISPGIHGESTSAGCFENLDDVDVDACVAAIRDGGERIWGIAINTAASACGDNDPREILRRALDAAETTARPLLYGVRMEPPGWSLAEQLGQLRGGDVVTYCFRAGDQSIVRAGRVVDAAWEARERGVLFDVGHGMASLDFEVAEAAIDQGFLPDTISTDVYRRHVGSSPVHDLPRTISKMLAVGLPEPEAFSRATARPAGVLGLSGEVGTLAPGSCADVAVLRWNRQAAPLVDVSGATRPGGCWEPVATVRGGRLVASPEAA